MVLEAVSESMKPATPRPLTLALVFSSVLPFAACGVDVHEVGTGKNVDIKSPMGSVSVRTDVDNPNTGLRVYPGARPLRDSDDPESANVNVSSRWFDVRVVAAKYASPDDQDKILEFYRKEMRTYGAVTECRGEVDFRGRTHERRAVCQERPLSRDVQLVTGTEDRQRVVAVKPRGTGSEFSLVYVNTRN
jgi:hypothetical protein